MAAPAHLVTLNIGSQTIGLAEFRVIHGRLVLLNYRFRETPLDPETGQRRDTHDALHETAAALRETMREKSVGPTVAVPLNIICSRKCAMPVLP